MSKISLEPNASGAGTFTLAAPNSNTNRTLNLPDESGVLFSDGSGVPGSAVTGQLASSNMPAGSVIQVVSNIKTDTFFTTSLSFESSTDIPSYNVNIIPRYSSSEIYVTGTMTYSMDRREDEVYVPAFGLQLNADTNSGRRAIYPTPNDDRTHGLTGEFIGGASNDRANIFSISYNVVDTSISSTDEITYQISVIAADTSQNSLFAVNRPIVDQNNGFRVRAWSTITAMEIKR